MICIKKERIFNFIFLEHTSNILLFMATFKWFEALMF